MSGRHPQKLLGSRWLRLALGLVLASTGGSVLRSQSAATSPSLAPSTTHVLFMCPHGAAKSVLASAYFQRAAKERGLNVRVETAGVDPQESVSAGVAAHLQRNGYELPIAKPRAVTKEDLATADLVISIGCDTTGLAVKPGTLRQWDEVPGPTEDLAGAEAAIRRRVVALIEELVAQQRK